MKAALSPQQQRDGASEKRFRALIEHSHDAIVLCAADGTIVYASPSTTRIMGYEPEEIYQRNLMEFVRADSLETVGMRMAEALRRPGETIGAEGYARHKNGEWRYLEGFFTNLLDDPAVGAIVSNYRDATERREAEAALLESERRTAAQFAELEQIYRTAPVGLALHDRELRFVRINERLAAINGRPVAEHIGRTLHDVLPPELSGQVEPVLRAVLVSGKPVLEMEVRGTTPAKAGVERVWLVSYSPLQMSDGTVAGVGVVVLDITERRRTEIKLALSESRLRAVIDTEPECVKLLAADGSLLEMNPAGLRMVEADSFQQIENRCIYPLVAEEHRAAFKALNEKVFAGEPGTLEFEIVGLKGGRRWLETTAAPLRDAEGKVTALLGITRDITERKRSQLALEQQHEQLRALATNLRTAREEEAIRISREIHDQLGQALTGLQMDVTALRSAVERNGQSKEPASLVTKLQGMSDAIEQTLQTARRVAAELRPAMLDELGLTAAVEWQARQFEERSSIFCNLALPAEGPALEPERATAVFRIFQEVLNNVARHSHATEVSIELQSDAESTALKISDNGVGIGQLDQVRLRGHGLVGMQERALAAGLRLHLKSEAAGGTTVTIEIPNGAPG